MSLFPCLVNGSQKLSYKVGWGKNCSFKTQLKTVFFKKSVCQQGFKVLIFLSGQF